MKISILTFSKEDNFGANLQCYALLKTLINMGHSVDIIDIQLPPLQSGLLSQFLRIYQHYKFKAFRKEFVDSYFTSSFRTVDELKKNPPQSDVYIVGSDQVWNPHITKRLDPLIYFFSFLPTSAVRIAYAASFGIPSWTDKQLLPEVTKLIKKFSAISVREEQGITICKNTFKIEATEVCDPTLLLPHYDEICGLYDASKETNEIIYYKFVRNKNIETIIAHHASKVGSKYVKLLDFHKTSGSTIRPYVTIKEWLDSIRYSKLVITDSFHCMVFSILFHRPFIVMPSMKNRANRMQNLLHKLNLSEHFCIDESELSDKIKDLANKTIDYTPIDSTIREWRNHSLLFLKNALNK